jgi:hypothetical protein
MLAQGALVSPTAAPELLQPQWFLLWFLCLWLVVSAGLALTSGWFSLSREFRCDESIDGEHFRFASGSLGLWPFPATGYGNCLFLTVNDSGFGLSILFLFRLLSPPLFIPWSAVRSVEATRFLFLRYTVVRLLRGWPAVAVRGRAGRCLEDTYRRLSSGRSDAPR